MRLSRERLKAMKALYAKYANVLEKKSILNSSRMHLFTIKAHEKIYAHGIRRENKGTTNYPSSAVRRKYRKSNKYRILMC